MRRNILAVLMRVSLFTLGLRQKVRKKRVLKLIWSATARAPGDTQQGSTNACQRTVTVSVWIGLGLLLRYIRVSAVHIR